MNDKKQLDSATLNLFIYNYLTNMHSMHTLLLERF